MREARPVGSFTSLGIGIMWPLLEEDECSISFLLVRTSVPLEAWSTWAKNPVTWRTRFPGESIDG